MKTHLTTDLGLFLEGNSSSILIVYTDVDWAGCSNTHKSISSYVVFLGDNLISWFNKRQTTVSRSSVEVEYHAVVNGVAKASWL